MNEELIRALAARQEVRVCTDRSKNLYSGTSTLNEVLETQNEIVFSVYLGDRDGMGALGFDFDGEEAEQEADQLYQQLQQQGIAALLCKSGQRSKGWHVFVNLQNKISHHWAKSIRESVRTFYSSLDATSLSNTSIRPPGSPHRLGGYSTVPAGDEELVIEGVSTSVLQRLWPEPTEDTTNSQHGYDPLRTQKRIETIKTEEQFHTKNPKYPSRSEWAYACICYLINKNFTNKEIVQIITTTPVGERYKEEGNNLHNHIEQARNTRQQAAATVQPWQTACYNWAQEQGPRAVQVIVPLVNAIAGIKYESGRKHISFSIRQLSEISLLSTKTVQKYLKQLEQKGFITTTGKSNTKTNIYKLETPQQYLSYHIKDTNKGGDLVVVREVTLGERNDVYSHENLGFNVGEVTPFLSNEFQTVKEIQQVSSLNERQTRNALNKLVETGIVKRIKQGRCYLYCWNQKDVSVHVEATRNKMKARHQQERQEYQAKYQNSLDEFNKVMAFFPDIHLSSQSDWVDELKRQAGLKRFWDTHDFIILLQKGYFKAPERTPVIEIDGKEVPLKRTVTKQLSRV